MNIIFLTLAIYAHAYVVLGASTGTNYNPRSFKESVEEKCFKNSQSKIAFQNLEQTSHNYNQCARQALPKNPPHPVEQHDEFCGYFGNGGYYTCLKNVAADVLPCLNKTEIFFPHMILKAYNTTFNNFCGTNGLITTEYVFNTIVRNKDCLQEVYMEIFYGGKCIENLNLYENVIHNNVDINKHDYCIDMESFVSCGTGVVQQKCDDENLYLLISSVTDLFLNVCKE